jgi:hypothetical protein
MSSLPWLPITEANNITMLEHDKVSNIFRNLQVQKWLRLWVRSFCHVCISNMQSFELALDIIHGVLAAL